MCAPKWRIGVSRARVHCPITVIGTQMDETTTATAFYGVEVKPQAVEKAFCMALGIPFKVSVDNLSVSLSDPAIVEFAAAVEEQFEIMMIDGLPHRAEVFRHALSDLAHYHIGSQMSASHDQSQLAQVS